MWVFGYGSLLWNPGFPVAEQHVAPLQGWARSFCMRSIHHRGTEDNPGLVLALDADPDAMCSGLVLRVADGHEDQTLRYLRERELISSAYLEKTLPITIPGEGDVDALTFVIDPNHNQYCGGLPLDEQAEIIAKAQGGRGPNAEYLYNTVAQLRNLGLHDPDLVWLEARVRNILRA